MSAPAPQSPRERLLAADVERRRMVVRYVATGYGVLTALAVVQLFAVGGTLGTRFVNAAAVVGYAVARWLAQRDVRIGLQAGVLIANMQLLVTGTALTVTDPVEIGTSLMFLGLMPLLAAATLCTRGTLLTTLSAVGSIMLVVALQLRTVVPPASIGRTVGGATFFVLAAGVVATLSAAAANRSLREQIAREEAAAQARAAATAAEQRLRVLADQVSDLVSVHDALGRFTFASASYQHILELDPVGLIGRTATEVVHGDDLPQLAKLFLEALSGKPGELVSRIATGNGSFRTFHVRMVGIALDGRAHVALTARDITQLQQLTAELESGRRMDALGRLAGGVAHDFNNLLSVIGMCSGMVRDQLPPEHRAQRDLAVIEDAVQQAATLTGQLLSFARSQVLPGGRTAPGAAIEQLAPLLQRALGTAIELDLQAPASRWETQLGRGQVEQIVMNLALNARDAMPRGGRLGIRVSDRVLTPTAVPNLGAGEYIVVEVSDTGTGMTPEVLAHIFEPFFSTKTARGGTGLGLATSFGVARQVGGTLTAESAPGQGSTFRLYLPRASGEAEPASEGRSEQSAAGSSGLDVLVVDDDPRILELTARLLELNGHHAVTADSAMAALGAAKDARFDVLLTDVVLGREDGIELLASLRALQPQASAVVMSGFTPSPQRLDTLRQGGIVFLPKPFSAATLHAALQPRQPALAAAAS